MKRLLGRVVPNLNYSGGPSRDWDCLPQLPRRQDSPSRYCVYLKPLMREIGISRLGISCCIQERRSQRGWRYLPSAPGRPDLRRFLGIVLLLMAAAMTLLACSRTVWMLAVSFFALRLLGQGAIGIGTLTMTVRWFNRHRGRAFAIVALGYAVGEITFPSAGHHRGDFPSGGAV